MRKSGQELREECLHCIFILLKLRVGCALFRLRVRLCKVYFASSILHSEFLYIPTLRGFVLAWFIHQKFL